jgi:hypothetical protein
MIDAIELCLRLAGGAVDLQIAVDLGQVELIGQSGRAGSSVRRCRSPCNRAGIVYRHADRRAAPVVIAQIGFGRQGETGGTG